MFKASFQSLLLRVPTSVSRFLLIPVLARYFSVEEVGIYGLVVVGVTFALYALGLDFYVFNTRELIRREGPERARLLRDQLALHAVAYALVVPLLVGLFALGLLPWSVAPWFFALLAAEHLSMECQRVLFALSRPVAANAVLALRSGAWVLACAPLLVFVPGARSLGSVWLAWLLGALASLAAGAWALRDLAWGAALAEQVDRRWIAAGLRVSLPFLGSSLAIRGVTTVDRFALQHFRGEADVGVYAIFSGIANLVPILAEAGFVMTVFPKLVAASQQGDEAAYRDTFRGMAFGVVAALAVLGACAAASIDPLLALIGKPVYREAVATFWVLLAMAVASGLGFLPHYALYARGRDREIVLAAFAGLGVAVAGNLLLAPALGHLGSALATLAAMATVGLCKLLALVLHPQAAAQVPETG